MVHRTGVRRHRGFEFTAVLCVGLSCIPRADTATPGCMRWVAVGPLRSKLGLGADASGGGGGGGGGPACPKAAPIGQGGLVDGWCRVVAAGGATRVGKWLHPPAGPCVLAARSTNGSTARTLAVGFEGAVQPTCMVPSCDLHLLRPGPRRAPPPLTRSTILAGVASTGAQLGLCLANTSNVYTPGSLALTGGQAGQCCWVPDVHPLVQRCAATAYSVMSDEAGPGPLPTPTPEPTPALLEPNGGVFEARLSFGPGGRPAVMGLTFSTPNSTAASYSPVVLWGTDRPALGSSAACRSSTPRHCYTASPVVHACNMTGLAPSTRYVRQQKESASWRRNLKAEWWVICLSWGRQVHHAHVRPMGGAPCVRRSEPNGIEVAAVDPQD